MPHTTRDDHSERLLIHKLAIEEVSDDFAADVRRGLTARQKFLLPKYFYDELGSRLFEAICLLPEYYLTRAESEIFARRAGEIAERAACGSAVTLFELGSGSASKTRRVIEALLRRQARLLYVPVAISTPALYAGQEGRAEMHLESTPAQLVRIRALGLAVHFREGERVHTENSYKYDPAGLSALAAETGFRIARAWLDGGERFSSNLFVAS